MTPEQQARDLLDRLGYDDAQSRTAGDVLELAQVLRDLAWAEAEVARLTRNYEALALDHGELLLRLDRHRAILGNLLREVGDCACPACCAARGVLDGA